MVAAIDNGASSGGGGSGDGVGDDVYGLWFELNCQ